MPAYNFQQRFADAVQSGRKRQTIRQNSKGAQPGDIAYLFTGMRTKQCKRLGFARITEVVPIEIGMIGVEPYALIDYGNGEVNLVHSDLDKCALKQQQFGRHDYEPGQYFNNEFRTWIEFVDVRAIMAMLIAEGYLFEMADNEFAEQIKDKIDKVNHWYNHAKGLGRVE